MTTKLKTLESMSYRQWQQRNTERFQSLSKEQQKKTRQKGYYNVGWQKVKKSWDILSPVISLFDYKLNQGDLIGAIELSILEAEQGKIIAKTALEELKKNQNDLSQLANKTLSKYTLL